MKTKEIVVNDITIIEVSSSSVVNNLEDALEVIGSAYYQGVDKIIFHEKGLNPSFFDLKSGLAGEILQKASNYRVKLAIVGDFLKCTSESLKAFIKESNRGSQVNFVPSKSDAIKKLTQN